MACTQTMLPARCKEMLTKPSSSHSQARHPPPPQMAWASLWWAVASRCTCQSESNSATRAAHFFLCMWAVPQHITPPVLGLAWNLKPTWLETLATLCANRHVEIDSSICCSADPRVATYTQCCPVINYSGFCRIAEMAMQN